MSTLEPEAKLVVRGLETSSIPNQKLNVRPLIAFSLMSLNNSKSKNLLSSSGSMTDAIVGFVVPLAF